MDKNVFEKRADELQQYKRTDENIFPEAREERKTGILKYKAPYVPFAWLEKFLDLNQRQKIDKIDAEFVGLNIMASGHESKIISALRFLGLVDENGNATSRLTSLRVVGDDFEKNLNAVVMDAYHDLISTVVLNAAKPENVINFFVQRYDYSQASARNALRFFVCLASRADIALSEEVRNLAVKPLTKIEMKTQKGETMLMPSKPRYGSVLRTVLEQPKSTIQATVNINLDKDTPRELWDRVLALLGEKRKSEPEE
jgi:hypothetical protein